ncbi:uncharacterized protein LOC107632517 [Arachis ipaensis]|uniref:uncharacterized protein LOC107632517 n=1 Tax=Arachis ipaensis TaxID=130454 RepID=UPI0007AF6E0A|nr:uncharacterized protein LOC107632517 [Arachis ipaensis]
MDSEESFLVLVHSSGKIKKNKKHGVKFTDRESLSVFIRSSDTLLDLKTSILQKLGAGGTKWVKKLFYKIPIAVVSTGMQYEIFVLRSDEDMQVLFHCRRSFPEVRIHELFVKLEHGIDSSGASAPNPQSTTMGGAFTSMLVVAPECLLEYRPAGPVGVFTSAHPSPDVGREGEPDRVENAMLEDDSDEEPADIGRDNDDEIPINPVTCQPPSSVGTHEQPAHYSTLDLEAIGQPPESDPTFGGQGLHERNSVVEFQVGQSFHSKEEAVLTIKDYSIWRGVKYRVMESDHLKYHGRCKEFGKGCTWMICISLRARKGTLEVLQEATEGTYGFRPTYRKTWLTKQKAVAQIYGDWKESYAELPRWIIGVQSTMEGTVALLKTSLVRVSDDVDDSTVYFHRLF